MNDADAQKLHLAECIILFKEVTRACYFFFRNLEQVLNHPSSLMNKRMWMLRDGRGGGSLVSYSSCSSSSASRYRSRIGLLSMYEAFLAADRRGRFDSKETRGGSL